MLSKWMLNFRGQIPVVGKAQSGKKGMSPYQMVRVNFSLDGGPQRKKTKQNKTVFPFSISKLSQLAIIAYALRMSRHYDQSLVKCQFTTHLEHNTIPQTPPKTNKQTNNQPTAYRRQEPPLKKKNK